MPRIALLLASSQGDYSNRMAASGSIFTLLPFEGNPVPRTFETVKEALDTIGKHLRQRSSTAHKERVDLVALHTHTGQRFAQHVLIPDDLHASLRELHGVAPLVLLPPTKGGTSVVGDEAVVLFSDAHAQLKGLPPNKRGTMLLNACGLSARGGVYGDCFVGRLRADSQQQLALGSEAAPQLLVERSWLEAAQAAQKALGAARPPLESAITAQLAEMRRNEVAANVAAAAAGGTAVPTPPPPPPATNEAVVPTATKPTAESVAATGAGGNSVGESGTDGGAGKLEWLDSGDEVVVTITVPAGTKGKHIGCTIRDTSLKVEVTTMEASKRVVVDGKLFQEVDAVDCSWCVEDAAASAGGGRILTITLQKKPSVTGKVVRWLMLMRDN